MLRTPSPELLGRAWLTTGAREALDPVQEVTDSMRVPSQQVVDVQGPLEGGIKSVSACVRVRPHSIAGSDGSSARDAIKIVLSQSQHRGVSCDCRQQARS